MVIPVPRQVQGQVDEERPLTPPLLERDLELRAARLKLVVTDVDGVLTDGGVYYSAEGESEKRFSVRDGMGVERLRADGVEVAFLTREVSRIVERRAEKLKIRFCYMGIADKRAALPRLLADAGLGAERLAYIGDDVNDLELMGALAPAELTGAPIDAEPSILQVAHYRCGRPGGYGAFRDFADWILTLRARARRPTAADDREDL